MLLSVDQCSIFIFIRGTQTLNTLECNFWVWVALNSFSECMNFVHPFFRSFLISVSIYGVPAVSLTYSKGGTSDPVEGLFSGNDSIEKNKGGTRKSLGKKLKIGS